MIDVRLQPATGQDAPLLLALIQAAFDEYRPLLDPPSGAHRETAATLEHKVTEGGAFTAWLDGEAVGCVLYEPRPEALYLGRLAVLPEHRGRGIARLLVEAVEGQARALNLPRVTLGVRAQLPRNRAFFERLGYQVVAEDAHQGYAAPTFLTLEKQMDQS